VRQAIKVGGIQGIVMTKIDVLDGLRELRICIGYTINGERYSYLPAAMRSQAAAQPIWETLPGWSGTTKGARSTAELPADAVKYIRRIEELIEAPVILLTTGPERDDTIMMRDPFEG
jgi:adenylosuccinate synthase